LSDGLFYVLHGSSKPLLSANRKDFLSTENKRKPANINRITTDLKTASQAVFFFAIFDVNN